MHVILNGERKEIAAGTLSGLLGEMEYDGKWMAIAVNFKVVPRGNWENTVLSNGDQIEIITPRQGG